jgi:hypothetical protein
MTAHDHYPRLALAASIGIALWLATVTPVAAQSKAAERLGDGTQWFLTFINDPYGVKVEEIEELDPSSAATAINNAIGLPANDDPVEVKLLERHNKLTRKELPKKLVKFVEREFDAWRKAGADRPSKLEIFQPNPISSLAAATRQGKTMKLPVAAIGRDVVRATRDSTLFKLFMWTFSHPTYSTDHPSRHSNRYDLTGSCQPAFPPAASPKPCGGQAFMHSRAPDVIAAVDGFEKTFATYLRAAFGSASVVQ